MNWKLGFLSQYSPSTAKVNAQVLDEVERIFGRDVSELSNADIVQYQISLGSQALNTQKRKLATLKAAFKYLTLRGIVSENPMNTIRLPKTDRLRTIKWLKKDERNTLFDSLSGQERAIIAVALSGLRLAEIVSLNTNQYADRRLWNVEGKGGKVRTVPLTLDAAVAVEQHLATMPDGPMFSLRAGRRISRRSVQNLVARASEKAVGRAVTTHSLRHTFATLGAQADIPVLKLGRILGHANPAITEIYVHLDDQDLLDEMHKLDRPIGRPHLQLVQEQAG